MPSGDADEIGERRAIAVHRVEALHRDPRPPRSAAPAPVRYRILERTGIVMRDADRFSASKPHAVMGARMNERVVDQEVAALRKRGEGRDICRIAAREEQRRLRPQERRGLGLEHCVLGVVAAQQPGSPRADGHAARDRVLHRFREARSGAERQIIVRGEIHAQTRPEGPEAPERFQPFKIFEMLAEPRHCAGPVTIIPTKTSACGETAASAGAPSPSSRRERTPERNGEEQCQACRHHTKPRGAQFACDRHRDLDEHDQRGEPEQRPAKKQHSAFGSQVRGLPVWRRCFANAGALNRRLGRPREGERRRSGSRFRSCS